jgi:sigma-54 dependent transcriptional regulator, acetoin dehydrogenase operon transcriptional activator AcoR
MNLPAQPFFGTAAQRVALARQRFFDDGQRPSGLVGESVIQSWNRCLTAHRGPGEAIAFDPVSAVRAHTAAARSRALLAAAQQELLQLETALAGTACRVMLTDGQGVIVHTSRGNAAERPGVMPLAARVGVNLAESAIGTNAPGVVLHTGLPCTVLGGEHFFECVQAMHCAAAPVRDAAGGVVAVLDVSIEHRPFGFDAASVVGVYATAIENRWLVAQAQDHLVLHFQANPALLGTPLEALVAIDGRGRLAWLNGVARRLLADAAPGDSGETAFGLPLPGLLALTRRDDLALLHLPAGLAVWLRARLHARDGLVPMPDPVLPAALPPIVAPPSSLADHDRAHIERTLAECGGNIAATARRLGVSRGLLYRRLRAARAVAGDNPGA